MTAQLWCFGESGNAYKAALTMGLAGYDWTPVYVDFFNGEARSPAFRAINPMGEVPVFREGDLTLSQSAVIQLHVADRTVPGIGPQRDPPLADVRQPQAVRPGRSRTVPVEFPACGQTP
jgi:glutathione S-transferase